jgi:uncharacterized protein
LIIDSHTHLATYTNEGMTFAAIRDRLLSDMRSAGIGYSCILPDSDPGTAVADTPTVLETAAGHPELHPLGSVSIPGMKGTDIERLDRLAVAGRICGIKLYPGYEEFYPADRECRPLYEMCVRHDIPVVYHSGETLNEQWREEYNHPWEIAHVAERMPELKIIVAHFSQPHLEACRDIILRFPSIHADIAGLAHATTVSVCGITAIREIVGDTVRKQPEKVLFGTDWPICDTGEHIRLVESLKLDEKAREMVFSGNAKRLFRLP